MERGRTVERNRTGIGVTLDEIANRLGHLAGGRALAVRAVAAVRQHDERRRGGRGRALLERGAQRVELTRLGARIARAMDDQDRDLQTG